MSVATTTTNYGLPIFAGTDHGNWFDFNTGFQAIDTAIKAAAQAAQSAQTAAAAATKLANSASTLANSVNKTFTQYKDTALVFTPLEFSTIIETQSGKGTNISISSNGDKSLISLYFTIFPATTVKASGGILQLFSCPSIKPSALRTILPVLGYIKESGGTQKLNPLAMQITPEGVFQLNTNYDATQYSTGTDTFNFQAMIQTTGWFE